jgi:hypothetical protein
MPMVSWLTVINWSEGFRQLPINHRVVLALRHLPGMTPEEIAATLGPYEDSGADAALFTCSNEAGMTWSFSDPRLEGVVTRINEEVTLPVGDVSDVYVNSTAFSIENDGGVWRERPRTWLLPDGAGSFDWLPQEVLVFDGSGEYDGLVAVLRTTDGLSDFRGFIIDARWMPPAPENVSAE